ncbi:hypothetical protein C0J52_21006 [Blattella germanica]|nr:hypothetical protein C0J52_21006 [Blattella germanica]
MQTGKKTTTISILAQKRSVDEALHNNDDVEFTQEEIKQVIPCFNHNKAPGSDGITADILLRIFMKFLVENSREPSKYRPISLLNTGGKVFEKLLINRINLYLDKNELMQRNQFGFTPQRNTTDAAMEAKTFI